MFSLHKFHSPPSCLACVWQDGFDVVQHASARAWHDLWKTDIIGHVFCDSDTWMFPPLLLTHPAIARSLVMFRYHALPAAKANASMNGRSGAMYPWESDEDGKEATPRFAYQNALLENHVTGDVALAQWQYSLATADTQWLVTYGLPVIEATAEF